MIEAAPRRLKARSICYQYQDGQVTNALNQKIEEFERACVSPMGILEHHDHRTPDSQTFNVREQRCQGLSAQLRRAERTRGITLRRFYRSQRRNVIPRV